MKTSGWWWRGWVGFLALGVALAALAALAPPARAQGSDETVLQAREALRSKDRLRLASTRSAVIASGHALAPWVDYWELGNRLAQAQQPELDAFYARWPGSYVEDRLRNDWLLELGRRGDWARLRAEFPRFRMNDDRDVTCYALLARHLDGQDVRSAARAAWLAQRDPDEGCQRLGSTLYEARVLSADDAWQAARVAAEFNRPRVAKAAAALVSPEAGAAVAELFKDPARYLKRLPPAAGGSTQELALLALMRLAAADPEAAAAQIDSLWQRRLSPAQAATAWAHAGKQAALKLQPQATGYVQRAWRLRSKMARAWREPGWSDDLLAWQVRAALRLPAATDERWALVTRAVEAMSPAEQHDSAWVYWKARATQAQAAPGGEGDAARAAARQALETVAAQTGFYAKLATEDLGRRVALPAPPPPLAAAEREASQAHPGLARALQLISLGLRDEGVREWNFSLRGMPDRELLGAAQWACEREVWDRCINTSERTRAEVDMAQRFPTPYREQVLAKAREIGVDPAYMYGLIRQESRFIMGARSHAGASGLMQMMPATARWMASKIGLDYKPEMIADRDVNLRLGASYLKRVLDDFSGSQALAAAAYNAGPNRPRRWREGAVMEPAAWAECIPFDETRDYVKKVLSNAVDYAALLGTPGATLTSRLGPPVGPREPGAAAPGRDVP